MTDATQPEPPPPITPSAAAGRTTVQAGLPGALITLAYSFDWLHWNAAQTAAVLGLATVLSAYVMRVVEARTGHGFLRRVR